MLIRHAFFTSFKLNPTKIKFVSFVAIAMNHEMSLLADNFKLRAILDTF
jgi:hypothetical protein